MNYVTFVKPSTNLLSSSRYPSPESTWIKTLELPHAFQQTKIAPNNVHAPSNGHDVHDHIYSESKYHTYTDKKRKQKTQ